MSVTFFPSDFSEAHRLPTDGRVGGRVLASTQSSVTIGDAFQTLTLDHSGMTFEPNAWIVVAYHAASGRPQVQRVVESHAPARCPESGEFARLAPGRGTHLRARSRAAAVIRAFFEQEGFTEVDTPTFVPSPGLDPHVHSLAEVRRGDRVDHLITSPEFHMKRLLVGGMPRIFQFARCFRAEELGPLHEPEFTLLEWYRALAGHETMLRDSEEIVCRVFAELSPVGRTFTQPFARLSVKEAFERFAPGCDPNLLLARDPSEYFQTFVDAVEPGIAALPQPTFLVEFPLPLAALARPSPANPGVAERFELYVDGVELCNGYGELTDPFEQRRRFNEERARRKVAGDPDYPLDEKFLAALEEGMPPSAGNALGFERLVALARNLSSIGSAFAFQDSER